MVQSCALLPLSNCDIDPCIKIHRGCAVDQEQLRPDLRYLVGRSNNDVVHSPRAV